VICQGVVVGGEVLGVEGGGKWVFRVKNGVKKSARCFLKYI